MPIEAFNSLMKIRPVERSHAFPSRPLVLRAQPFRKEENSQSFFDPEQRPVERVVAIGGLWCALAAYVAIGAPGKDEASQVTCYLRGLLLGPVSEVVYESLMILLNEIQHN